MNWKWLALLVAVALGTTTTVCCVRRRNAKKLVERMEAAKKQHQISRTRLRRKSIKRLEKRKIPHTSVRERNRKNGKRILRMPEKPAVKAERLKEGLQKMVERAESGKPVSVNTIVKKTLAAAAAIDAAAAKA